MHCWMPHLLFSLLRLRTACSCCAGHFRCQLLSLGRYHHIYGNRFGMLRLQSSRDVQS